MNTFIVDLEQTKIQNVVVTDDALIVDFFDGRTITVPLAWYPRLLHGSASEQNNWKIIGNGEGIHWAELDEDISVENLVFGKRSGESQNSFKKWIEKRKSVNR
ncbi:MAG: DUF2442 domain-containing protein [Bacteroidetes bacterium]|nr:DUF2442 domain-containing protein [Bacteroidota bacterium]MBU2585419.1 DUF2442 domain-containing protein [Bacteroidota bacterium]